MSSTIEPSAVKVGDYVKLVVLDDVSIAYSGKVTGVVTYPVARSMGQDLAARHEQIKASVVSTSGSLIADVVDQTFLVIDTGDTIPVVVAFDWIADNKVELIELGATYTIKLLNCSKEKAEEAVTILRANSISCKLNVVY